MKLKATRRTDWGSYIDPMNQERARRQRWYKISSRIEACLNGDGQLDLIVEDEGRHAVTTLSRAAQRKLALLMKEALR